MSVKEFSQRFNDHAMRTSEVLDISGRDLNEILTTGAYGGVNCTNVPAEGYIQLIVTKHTNSWVVQEVMALNKDIHLRAYQNGIWYRWNRIDLNEDNDYQGSVTIEVVERPHTHPNATAESKGFMSNTDKIKLDAIETGANNYVHPQTHPADIIRESETKKFVSSEQISKWDNYRLEIDSSLEVIKALQQACGDLINRVSDLEEKLAEHTEI